MTLTTETVGFRLVGVHNLVNKAISISSFKNEALRQTRHYVIA